MDSSNSSMRIPAPSSMSQYLKFVTHTVGMVITQPVLLFGCFSNVVNMVVFARQGFSDSINVSFFGLAVSDFGSCFALIFLQVCFHPSFVTLSTLPFHPEACYIFLSWPRVVCVKITTILTALIVFERCLCVVIPLKIKTIITARRVTIFVIFTYIAVPASVIPAYFANQLGWKFNPFLNRTVLGLVYPRNRNEIESAMVLSHNMILSISSFIFISVCTAILYTTLIRNAMWRQSATSGEKANDLSSKDKKISKMVVIIATLFIVCLIPFNVQSIAKALDEEFTIRGKKYDLFIIVSGFTMFAESINAGVNMIIYYFNSSRYQTTFRTTFGCKQ